MSVVPFRRMSAASRRVEVDPYYRTDPRAAPDPQLRRLSEIEQMYAYWGSDLANPGMGSLERFQT